MFVVEGGTQVVSAVSINFVSNTEATAEIEYPAYYTNHLVLVNVKNGDTVARGMRLYLGTIADKYAVRLYATTSLPASDVMIWPNHEATRWSAALARPVRLGGVYRFLTVIFDAGGVSGGGTGYMRAITHEINTGENAADE